jgi:sensor c-di-GMP phosphodiesterase-like protein
MTSSMPLWSQRFGQGARLRARSVVVGLAAVGMFLLCVGGSFWLASYQGREQAKQRGAELAEGVMGMVEAIDAQVEASIAANLSAHPDQVCDASALARMQATQARYGYIGAIGRVGDDGHQLLCSTLGPAAGGLRLGGPELTDGTRRLYQRVVLPGNPGIEYFVVLDRGVAVFVHRGVANMVLSTLRDVSLGAFQRPHGTLIFSRGVFDFPAIQALEHSGEVATFDGRLLVALSRSAIKGYATFVVIPAARVNRDIRAASVLLIPLGVLLGLALSTLLYGFLRERTSTAAALKRALNSSRVFMEYQPIVDLATGRCTGAEALVRWERGGRRISPDRFIAAAEHAGIMPLVTSRVIALVARDMADFLRQYPDFHVSINLSARDLYSRHALDLLTGMLRTTGLPAASFWVEITESQLVEEEVIQTVEQIRDMGIRVAVDDFGTGYSNLGVLERLEVDLLKIDKRFVQSVSAGTGRGSEVAVAIVGVARTLSLEMVAEGVETQAQADFLLRSGVQFGQGWLFGRPGSVAQLRQLVAVQARDAAQRSELS